MKTSHLPIQHPPERNLQPLPIETVDGFPFYYGVPPRAYRVRVLGRVSVEETTDPNLPAELQRVSMLRYLAAVARGADANAAVFGFGQEVPLLCGNTLTATALLVSLSPATPEVTGSNYPEEAAEQEIKWR